MPWILSFRNWWWICPYYPDTPAKRLYHKSLWEFWYECFSSFLSHHKIAGISNYYILMIEILSYPNFFFLLLIRKYGMYGVLGHLCFCLWLRHPRWPQWCVVACYVRSVSMRAWCETTTGVVVVLFMLCYGRAPLFTGFPLGKSQLTIEQCHSFD